MKFEKLQPDLQKWFREMIARGTAREELVRALLTAGYGKQLAEDSVDAACRAVKGPERSQQPGAAPPPAVAGPTATPGSEDDGRTFSEKLAATRNTFTTADREVTMLFALAAPRVILFGNVLSSEECDELIEASRSKLARSSVVNAATGQYDQHPHRTSSGTHFARGETATVRRIERRISELLQQPEERGEPLQILHYEPGGEYRPHFDYFDPDQPGNEQVLAQGGQRVATLVMYLNDVMAGGSTVFPAVGLEVLPRKGSGVFFAYTTDQGELDARSLHGGSPVTAGEKWIATKWFRQRTYGGPGA